MKQFKITFLFAAILTLGLMSCGNKAASTENTDATQTEATTDAPAEAPAAEMGKEHTSTYVCPMHCAGSGSEETGKCPVCGMDYVMNTEHQKDGHKHEGHDH